MCVVEGYRTEVAFSLGSNMGDKMGRVRQALACLANHPGVDITAVSRFYRTAPWGLEEQDWFVNSCAIGFTSLSPHALVTACQRIEKQCGRTRDVRWGPRIVDIDLLYFGDLHLESQTLILPHAELYNRAFVLVPLAEIAPERKIGEVTVQERLAALQRRKDDVIAL